jgi:hypothetical protein
MLGDEIRDGFYYVPRNEDGVTWIEYNMGGTK